MVFSDWTVLRYNLKMKKTSRKDLKPSRSVGAVARFLEEKLSQGEIAFTLTELTKKTGLSLIAARRQLSRLGTAVTRVAPRQEFFLFVSPDQRPMGAPPEDWWLDAYFKWLGRPYYLGLQSAAARYGSMSQAVQVTQVMTDRPRRSLKVGRLQVQFFVKTSLTRTPTQTLPNTYAPLTASTPEATCLDLIRYAQRIGGLERAAETIKPLIKLLDGHDLTQALQAEADVSTAHHFEKILKDLKQTKLSSIVRKVCK